MIDTPIQYFDEEQKNSLYIKRDDLIPISFGGNKARKALNFYKEIDEGGYDCVVTYGSSSSNHCRIISNMAAARNLPCYIIGPEEASKKTFNSQMMELFSAEITVVPVHDVTKTIEEKLKELRRNGKTPYFIAGGGHGNLGTQAYVDCYKEIKQYEQENNTFFDYIFFASGTGTTQAGLVCGQILEKDEKKIVGISIARKNPRGRDIIIDSIREYLTEHKCEVIEDDIQNRTIFVDDYIGNGYGRENREIEETIKKSMIQYGIPLDSTYTGKAFWGMKQYIQNKQIKGKNILFIHTGGTPLFFDDLGRMAEE
jgi:D-cysteine desulfhydrase